MNAWQQELERCRVANRYREIDIFWIEDLDYHQHVEVYGKLSETSVLEEVGGGYCHGFYVWDCDCSDDHSDPDIIAGWCKVPHHATEILAGTMSPNESLAIGQVTITRSEAVYPRFNIQAICYKLRIPNGILFELYNKPNNVGMIIIKPVQQYLQFLRSS